MIQIGSYVLDLNDPVTLGVVLATGFALTLLVLLLVAIRTAGRSARMAEPIAERLVRLDGRFESMKEAQLRLDGGLTHVSEAQAAAQAQMLTTMERRLEEVTRSMGDTLHGSATRTARSLGELQQRLETIDRAQSKIEKLSGDVLGLQDILSNKQTRGAFGEIQLHDIVAAALPPDAYRLQATLSTGVRADCLILMPGPPGPIVIDSKFPLEPYEALRVAQDERDATAAARAMRAAVRSHIRAISGKYIIDGETAEGALMFVPSEAVYAELHANFADLVREGFEARVWLVSPTTCMATLNTLRSVLKDVRMREQASAIRKELSALLGDLKRLGDRVDNLDRHFGQVQKDVSEIRVSTDKAGRRAQKLEDFDFSETRGEVDSAARTAAE
ncbi:MAG: DNA recombination protein RmuC [Pseudomonadota bacterium]